MATTTSLPPRPIWRLRTAGLLWIALALGLLTMAVGIPFVTGGIAFALLVRVALGALDLFFARALARGGAAPVRALGALTMLAPVVLFGGFLLEQRAGTVRSYAPSYFLPETSADHVYAVRSLYESPTILGLDPDLFLMFTLALFAIEVLVGLSILVARRTPVSPS